MELKRFLNKLNEDLGDDALEAKIASAFKREWPKSKFAKEAKKHFGSDLVLDVDPSDIYPDEDNAGQYTVATYPKNYGEDSDEGDVEVTVAMKDGVLKIISWTEQS